MNLLAKYKGEIIQLNAGLGKDTHSIVFVNDEATNERILKDLKIKSYKRLSYDFPPKTCFFKDHTWFPGFKTKHELQDFIHFIESQLDCSVNIF